LKSPYEVFTPWEGERNKLLSWWDMQRFSAATFQQLVTGFVFLISQIENLNNHTKEYVRGQVHTQGIDNFWSLLKRGLTGTYVAVEPFHLDRYVDEEAFRYNNRATTENPLNDADRFALVVSQIVGRRITYAQLTGKADARPF
jgi:hypothetical protein